MNNIYEKLGLFYLGKIFDSNSGELTENLTLYDSKDLLTHAVCVGMTGSGKTGLCIALLEEAVIDNIPAIIIDPKGDLGNLLLSFPNLEGKDFLPWINPDEARQQHLSPESFATQQAELWKNGLAKWDQDGERIASFKSAAEFLIYTPGSSAGLPVSIVKSFSSPISEILEDLDLLRERVQTTTSGILGLLGIDADPLQSREHILLSNIIENAWINKENLDLGRLIQMIQTPPMSKIGVFDLESFYPASERFKLSMILNNLLAAPGFKSWMEGAPLEIDELLYTETGKPRVLIFSIAHLSDSERMFFVTLLFNQVLGWIRTKSGTTSLRAILYMDEVFGFLPPVGEPPSKKPLLTLLKQARAFGLGVVLSTQNPVDLDYKALSNIGTWFIGRLQTEQDKERLADGLTSAGGESQYISKQSLMEIISGLKKRQFLLQNVHEKHPQLFNTRWVLSYLCGPLTRNQIKILMQDRVSKHDVQEEEKISTATKETGQKSGIRPQIRPEIRQYFAPISKKSESEGDLVYHAFLFAGGDIQIFNNRYGLAQIDQIAHLLVLNGVAPTLTWDQARAIDFHPNLIIGEELKDSSFQSLPPEIVQLSKYNDLDKQYETFVYRNYQITLLQSAATKLISKPGESEKEFRLRLQQSSHERRDLEIERLKRRYASKLDSLEKQILAAQQSVDRETDQYDQKKLDTAISFGTGLLGALFGGGSRSRNRVGRATRSTIKLSKEKEDIYRAQKKLALLHEQRKKIDDELENESIKIVSTYDAQNETLKKIIVKPKKSDILQKYYGILWIPFLHQSEGRTTSLNTIVE